MTDFRNDREANLYAKHEIDASLAFPSCSGACKGNPKDCPAPQSCQLAEPEKFPWLPVLLMVAILVVVFGLWAWGWR